VVSLVAGISGLYDFVVGAFLLLAPDTLASLFGVPPASPPIFSNLNALFLISIGIGYVLPWREPDRYRGYMWVMGPILKGAGAIIFLFELLLPWLARVVLAVRGQRRDAGVADAVGVDEN